MTEKDFKDGMAILQGATGRNYRETSFPVWWNALKDESAGAYLSACRELAKTEERLPPLSLVLERLNETKRGSGPSDWSAETPQPTSEEFEATSKMLRETTLKLKARARSATPQIPPPAGEDPSGRHGVPVPALAPPPESKEFSEAELPF